MNGTIAPPLAASSATNSARTYEPIHTRVRAVLIDDDVLFRTGLRKLLQQADVEVVGEASNARVGVELVRRTTPGVVILELGVTGAAGFDAIREITAAEPHTPVLVLTACAAAPHVTGAVLAGACGYLVKDSSTPEILAAVRTTAAGETMISPQVARTLFEHLRQSGPPIRNYSSLENLSDRERAVLRLVVDGMDSANIAKELFISPYTVKNHLSNIFVKLQVENRVQAAVRAIRESMI
jgi:DNA-binding NarL/FixJ family response regulator